MTTKLDPSIKKQLDTQGVALTGDIGGQKKKRYWKPDGTEVMAIPGYRDYIRRDKDGNTIESGTRDANYDKGWLDHPPGESEIKLACRFCGKWHDTEKEIKDCEVRKKKFDAKYMKIAKKEAAKDNADYEERISKLEEGISDIKEMLAKALGGK